MCGTHTYLIVLNIVWLLSGMNEPFAPHRQCAPPSLRACQHLVLSTVLVFASMMDVKCQHINLCFLHYS